MNLSLFCDEPGGRYDLDKPFVRAGFRYTTNCRIAVRIPTKDADTNGRYPKIQTVFETSRECNTPWPEWKHSWILCSQCIEGLTPVKCDKCHGNGDCVCSCGNEHDCHGCDGKCEVAGPNKCPWCGGKGKVLAPRGKTDVDRVHFVELGGKRFGAWYLWLIESQFTGLRYAVGGKYLRFNADENVEGMLICRAEGQDGITEPNAMTDATKKQMTYREHLRESLRLSSVPIGFAEFSLRIAGEKWAWLDDLFVPPDTDERLMLAWEYVKELTAEEMTAAGFPEHEMSLRLSQRFAEQDTAEDSSGGHGHGSTDGGPQ